MSGETESRPSGWTLDTWAEHSNEVRRLEALFREERDRRYTEVNTEREKALKIKETADLAALQLAREIQTYKDEKANELRAQIERERGTYATRGDLTAATERIEALILPLTKGADQQAGSREGVRLSAGVLLSVLTLLLAVSVAAGTFVSYAVR